MKMKKLILALIFGGSLLAQTPPTSIQISQQPLPIVQGVSAIYTGAAGTSTFYYYVVAKYGVGDANVSAAVEVDNINPLGGGSVALSWGAPANPSGYSLSYDVLRSTSAQFPGTCNCLVSGAQTGNTATDSLGALSSYSANAYNPFSSVSLSLDNVNSKSILLNGILNGQNIMEPFSFPSSGANSQFWWIQPKFPNSSGNFGVAPNGSSIISRIRASNSPDLINYGYAELIVNGTTASLNMSNAGNGNSPTSLNVQFNSVTACTFTSSGLSGIGCGAGGSGTVTSFSSGGLSPLFTTSVATATTTPALSFSLSNAAQNAVLAGPSMGGSGAPSYRALVAADLPASISGLVNTVASSSTPAFNLALGNTQYISALATNATMTISNLVAGGEWTFIICLDGTGSETFTWSAAFHGAMTIGLTASKCNVQTFRSPDGTNIYATSTGVINQ